MTKTSKLRPYFAAAVVNLLVLSFGLSVGWMSPAVHILLSKNSTIGGDEPADEEMISWLGSLQFLGGVSGVLFWGQIAERYGRKPAGYLLSIPLLVGWSFVLFARNHFLLYAGRFIMGLSGTGSLVLIPLYVGEMSEDSYRGELGSFLMLFFNLGVVLAYFVGAIVSLENLTLFCDLIPILFLICFFFLPESPVYLWTKGKKEEAKKSLLWFRSGNNVLVERELTVIDSVVNSNSKDTSVPLSRLYDNKGTIKGMIIGFALYFSQQFCGILMILTYLSEIIIKSTINFSPDTAQVIIGVAQVIATYISSLLVDRINRKVLLIISNMGMFTALFIIGSFFYLQKNPDTNFLPNWVPFAFIGFHVTSYTLSASMAYIITAEVLTPEIRPLALSVTSFLGTLLAFVSVKLYKTLVENVGMHGNFWFFAFWCLLTIFFTIFFIPETRGKSLIDILKQLNGKKVVKDNKKDVAYDVCSYELPIREQQC